MFSLPLNPFLSQEETMNVYIPFLKKFKPFLDNVYFNCSIPPFLLNSKGELLEKEKEYEKTVQPGLLIKEETGINIIAVFNSTLPSSNPGDLEVFLENFAPLYKKGIYKITLPWMDWVRQVKDEYPLCKIGSSGLVPVANGQTFIEAGRAGYDFVQIDSSLIRNQKELREIALARVFLREKYARTTDLFLMANEPWEKKKEDKSYFHPPLKQDTSPDLQEQDPLFALRECDLSPWKKNWDEMLEYIQIFTLQGLEDVVLLNKSMRMVKNFAFSKEVIDEEKYQFFTENKISQTRINRWIQKTRNCQNQCWKCNICDKTAKRPYKKAPDLEVMAL